MKLNKELKHAVDSLFVNTGTIKFIGGLDYDFNGAIEVMQALPPEQLTNFLVSLVKAARKDGASPESPQGFILSHFKAGKPEQ
jgi:hypothetical protein